MSLRNHCCDRKAISVTYSECEKAEVLRGPLEPIENKKTSECVFVSLVIQHVKRMHSILLSYMACLAIQYFSTLFHKRHYLKKMAFNIKCVL
jgi:hypothetical protein